MRHDEELGELGRRAVPKILGVLARIPNPLAELNLSLRVNYSTLTAC
jgi:hypothetical protein